ncbi:isochorismatase family cysteine hydrolase [Ignatzschineria larvae DSM 13226]|uniref:Isochorismatase family cysteine hydrolase n=1 Tax=Ignatzschineria larvae DSM 13226 TaxID=1111732 RepID=A0ABZ3C196_9GAMM|nr:isochorismatase family cysteine hydrolase [Ignatzschineria larvae]
MITTISKENSVINKAIINKALIIIDLINDIASEDGLSNSSYSEIIHRDIITKTNQTLELADQKSIPVIAVKVGFADDYHDIPSGSPMFHHAKEIGAFKLSGRGCDWVAELALTDSDSIWVKKGVSAFAGNDLADYLKDEGIETLYFAGVSSLLAIQSSVRLAHDLGFTVYVIEDLCAAGTFKQHEESMEALTGLAKIIQLTDLKKAWS